MKEEKNQVVFIFVIFPLEAIKADDLDMFLLIDNLKI